MTLDGVVCLRFSSVCRVDPSNVFRIAALRAEIFRISSCCSAPRLSDATAEKPMEAAAETPLRRKIAIRIDRTRRTLTALPTLCSKSLIGAACTPDSDCAVLTTIDAAFRLESARRYGAIIDRAV